MNHTDTAGGEQLGRVRSEQVERDAPLFTKQPLALHQPLRPSIVVFVDAATDRFFILR